MRKRKRLGREGGEPRLSALSPHFIPSRYQGLGCLRGTFQSAVHQRPEEILVLLYRMERAASWMFYRVSLAALQSLFSSHFRKARIYLNHVVSRIQQITTKTPLEATVNTLPSLSRAQFEVAKFSIKGLPYEYHPGYRHPTCRYKPPVVPQSNLGPGNSFEFSQEGMHMPAIGYDVVLIEYEWWVPTGLATGHFAFNAVPEICHLQITFFRISIVVLLFLFVLLRPHVDFDVSTALIKRKIYAPIRSRGITSLTYLWECIVSRMMLDGIILPFLEIAAMTLCVELILLSLIPGKVLQESIAWRILVMISSPFQAGGPLRLPSSVFRQFEVLLMFSFDFWVTYRIWTTWPRIQSPEKVRFAFRGVGARNRVLLSYKRRLAAHERAMKTASLHQITPAPTLLLPYQSKTLRPDLSRWPSTRLGNDTAVRQYSSSYVNEVTPAIFGWTLLTSTSAGAPEFELRGRKTPFVFVKLQEGKQPTDISVKQNAQDKPIGWLPTVRRRRRGAIKDSLA